MKVISLLNMKGGVAKSFTAVNMAYELWRRGYRVLILDNDKQGNTSRAYRRYDAESVAPAAKLLAGEWDLPEELIQATDYEGIDIITANMSLFGAACRLMRENGGDITGRYQRLFRKGAEKERAAENSRICDKYDYCIIDNRPDIGINVVNALAVTDEVIVPVKIDEDALEGLDIVAEQIEDARAINPLLTLKGVLVTSYQKTDGELAGLKRLRGGHPVLGVIRYSKKAAENSFLRKPIYEYSLCCGAVQDYKAFVTAYTGKGR